MGARDGWVQLWRLLAPSGRGAAGRETLPALGIQPSTAATRPLVTLVPWLPGSPASPGPLLGWCDAPSLVQDRAN